MACGARRRSILRMRLLTQPPSCPIFAALRKRLGVIATCGLVAIGCRRSDGFTLMSVPVTPAEEAAAKKVQVVEADPGEGGAAVGSIEIACPSERRSRGGCTYDEAL